MFPAAIGNLSIWVLAAIRDSCDDNSGFQDKKQELVRFSLKQFHNKFLKISRTKKLISLKTPEAIFHKVPTPLIIENTGITSGESVP
jgi:hypothetical protein